MVYGVHCRMRLVVLLVLIVKVSCNTECIWALGRVTCESDPEAVLNTVVEVWDKDGPSEKGPAYAAIDGLDKDDKAGMTVVTEETGEFRVEGCASDVDWLPWHKNRPEFYFRVRHSCGGVERTMELLPPVKVFAPNTYDYYMDHPIKLD